MAGVALTVKGTGLIPYSIVVFDGHKLKTSFIDEFQVTAAVPARLLKPGASTVTVENPDYGSLRTRGAPDLTQLGVFDHISNPVSLIVRSRTENQ